MGDFDKDYRICFPEKRIFISRDHQWAFAAWELAKMYEAIKPNSTLIHVDAHLDDVWDGIEVEGLLSIQTIEDIYKVTANEQMKIDNFIWAGFATDAIQNVIYVARQKIDDHDPFDLSDWDFNSLHLESVKDLIKKKKYDGIRIDYVEEFRELYDKGLLDTFIKDKDLILDIDLDYFNLSNDLLQPELMDTERIISTLKYLRDLFDWSLITVALSPLYCGGDNECWQIYEIFLDVFGLKLSEAEIW
ncbi:hypothetical protein [Bacillus smithii]|uniref:hypothetical protein n=1 Tax=Bacillus smithii TaxID=1479 RepID=UPI002E21AC72|nr:hypothetical protein [Bacillus smithii]MED4929031.1 hypothetical protein [Bacillus smithii]